MEFTPAILATLERMPSRKTGSGPVAQAGWLPLRLPLMLPHVSLQWQLILLDVLLSLPKLDQESPLKGLSWQP